MRMLQVAGIGLWGAVAPMACSHGPGQAEPQMVRVPASVVDVPPPDDAKASREPSTRPRRSGVRVLFEESPPEGSIGLGEQMALLVDAALKRRPLPVGGIPVERSKGQVYVRDEAGVRRSQLEYLMFKASLEVVLNETRTCPAEGQSVALELYWLESGLRVGRAELGEEALGFESQEWAKQLRGATELVMQRARTGQLSELVIADADLEPVLPQTLRDKLVDSASKTFEIRELAERLDDHDFEFLYRVRQLELVARDMQSGRLLNMSMKLEETDEGFELVQSPLVWVREFTGRR